MSDYQVTNYGLCGECKWHTCEEIDRGYVCTNADSPYCTDWTDYTDTCECEECKYAPYCEQYLVKTTFGCEISEGWEVDFCQHGKRIDE